MNRFASGQYPEFAPARKARRARPLSVALILLASFFGSGRTLSAQAAAGAETTGVSQDASRGRGDGSIVFVGVDDNIHLLDPTSGKIEAVTSNAGTTSGDAVAYRYPVWSHDGQLAFVRYEQKADGSQVTAIGRYRKDGELTFTDQLGGISPFYLYFSPDGSYLSVLGSGGSAGSLGLFLLPAGKSAGRIVATGQPLYWSWLPDDQGVLIHSGGTTPDDRVILQSLASGIGKTISISPGAFQAPAVSSDGTLAGLSVNGGDTGSQFIVSNRDASIYYKFVAEGSAQALAWSPRDRVLALVDGQPSPFGGVVGRLRIIDLRDPGRPALSESGFSDVGPFWWSPDGRNIAMFRMRAARTQAGIVPLITVDVYDLAAGTTKELATVIPERDFVSQVAPFYDQYQRSATIWSPDSTRIVISATTNDGTPGIFILDAASAASAPGRSQAGTVPGTPQAGTVPGTPKAGSVPAPQPSGASPGSIDPGKPLAHGFYAFWSW